MINRVKLSYLNQMGTYFGQAKQFACNSPNSLMNNIFE